MGREMNLEVVPRIWTKKRVGTRWMTSFEKAVTVPAKGEVIMGRTRRTISPETKAKIAQLGGPLFRQKKGDHLIVNC